MPVPHAGYNISQDWVLKDVMQIVVEGTNEGTPFAIVRHYYVSVLGTGEPEAILKDFWVSDIIPLWQALLTDKWQVECITVSRAAPGPRNPAFYPLTAMVGEITTDGVPNGTALLYKLLTDETGARARGRLYLCGLPESATNAGLLLGTQETSFGAVGAKLMEVVSDSGNELAPCIFSRAEFNDLPADFTQAQYEAAVGEIAPQITDVLVIGNLASQRDRRPRRNTFGA